MKRDNKLTKIEKVVDDWLNKRSVIALDAMHEIAVILGMEEAQR